MEIEQNRLCPCCQQTIEGQVDNPNLRKGAKMGAKFLVKQGVKAVAGESIAASTAAVGATIGSVVPVVGNFIGYVAGYTIGHVAQELAFESAYDAAENKYAARKYRYYCPSCNLSWTSNDTNDRTIIIDNIMRYYNATKQYYPQKPKDWLEDNSFREKLSFVSPFCLIIAPLVCWIKSAEDIITLWVVGFFAFLTAIVWLVNMLYYLEWKENMSAYYKKMEEVNNYNKKLHEDALNRLNTTIRNSKGRLGSELTALPGVRFVDIPTNINEKDNLGNRITGVFKKVWNTIFQDRIRGGVFIAILTMLIIIPLCYKYGQNTTSVSDSSTNDSYSYGYENYGDENNSNENYNVVDEDSLEESLEENTDETESCPIEISSGTMIGNGMAVDLGLSAKWATCNIGATNSIDVGDAYRWGCIDTSIKGDDDYISSDYSAISAKYKNNSGVLSRNDDVAHVNLGGNWHIPTEAEMKELLNKCKWEKIEDYDSHHNKFWGYKVTGKNGNSIFLPLPNCRHNGICYCIGEYSISNYKREYSNELNESFFQVASINLNSGDGVVIEYHGAGFPMLVRPVTK